MQLHGLLLTYRPRGWKAELAKFTISTRHTKFTVHVEFCMSAAKCEMNTVVNKYIYTDRGAS